MGRWGFVALLVAVGCADVTFTTIRSQYAPRRVRTSPDLCFERRPERYFEPVGVIDVASGVAAEAAGRLAAEKAAEAGCDVIIDARVDVTTILRPGAESLARCGGHCFICGLYVAPPPPVPDDS